MKKIPRRDKLIIYGDLLAALQNRAGSEKIVLSQVQTKINLPYDRMKTYIKDLVELGLVEDQTSLKLTSKGKQYIKEYKRVLDFIKRMGISYG
jgi:predicted transcriptional regulator